MRTHNPLSTLSEDVVKDTLYLTNAEAAALIMPALAC